MVDFTGGTWRSLIDGSEVNTIPDFAVLQQFWDEGSGTTVADIIGSNDGTIEGATWTENPDYEGGFGLSFDGTDWVGISNPSNLFVDDVVAAITVNFDSIASNQVITNLSDGSDGFSFGIERDNDGDFALRDQRDSTTLSESGVFSTGTDYRVSVYIPSDTSEPRRAFVNGSELDLPGTNDLSLVGKSSGFGGSPEQSWNTVGDGDNPILYANPDNLVDVVQEDYNAQPWS